MDNSSVYGFSLDSIQTLDRHASPIGSAPFFSTPPTLSPPPLDCASTTMEGMDDAQQKDYLGNFMPSDLDQQQLNSVDLQNLLSGIQSGGQLPPSLDMNMLGSLMSMQTLASPQIQPTSPHFPPSLGPTGGASQMMMEQQFKLAQLQQLQQLQTQIFQQQIALLANNNNNNNNAHDTPMQEPHHGAQQYGLPTPGPSTELRAQQQSLDFVPTMFLNYPNHAQQPQADYGIEPMTPHPHSMNPPYPHPPRGVASAPAHIVFDSNASIEIDDPLTPLTSPWLGAQSGSHHPSAYTIGSKRHASSSGDEGSSKPSKKRQSPAVHPYNPQKRAHRGSKTAHNTPQFTATRSRRGSIIGNDDVGDSPSPVDLSMPPPASTSGHDAVVISSSVDSSLPAPLVPVTPASIMKLGRLGVPGNNSKAKAPVKTQQTTIVQGPASGVQRSRSTRGASVSASPALKPIAPAGSSATMTIRPNAAAPAVGPRKTSHKAAEQKRRDSLKTTFDELRGLIPPIPMSTDSRNQDEPVRPGALPPRGPPKTGVEGPNRAVSKLQLLMCGNDFIRQLKGRVERRDDEIGRLRMEVERLRNVCMLAAPSALDEGEGIDLSRDLDDVEQLVNGFTRRMGVDDDMDDGDVDD